MLKVYPQQPLNLLMFQIPLQRVWLHAGFEIDIGVILNNLLDQILIISFLVTGGPHLLVLTLLVELGDPVHEAESQDDCDGADIAEDEAVQDTIVQVSGEKSLHY